MEELQQAKKEGPVEILTKGNIILLCSSVVTGILFDFLFFDKPMGISLPIFVIMFYIMFGWNMKKHLLFKLDFAWLLSVPVLALSFTYLIFSNEMFRALNFMAIPILIVAQTVLISRNNNFKWYSPGFIADILFGLFIRPLMNAFTPFAILSRLFKRKAEPGKYAVAGKILIGLIISVPLLAVVIMLLASADKVFEHFLGSLPDLFKDLDIGKFISHVIIILIISLGSFSYIFGLLLSRIEGKEITAAELKPVKKCWDPIIILTVLISINLVYVFFTAIQFTYLFGGVNLGLPKDFTYADYARRGFFELVFVTLINLSILLGCIGFTKQGGGIIDKTLKGLESLLVGCTVIMLISAHIRMSLYEEAYGYTYLRLLTHAFMIFILVLLLAALYKVWVEKVNILRIYIVIALIAYVMINYANIDVMIAKNNIERYHKTKNIDISYLTGLSYDAVPYTIELLKDSNKEVAAGIENDLLWKKMNLEGRTHWQSFNVSEYMARNILSKYELKHNDNVPSYGEIMRD